MKKITDFRAPAQLLLIELLGANESMDSVIHVADNAKLEAPQAYILDIGPMLDRKQYGIEVGDRIIFSGMMTPLPKIGNSTRQRGIIDPFAVKCVLKE